MARISLAAHLDAARIEGVRSDIAALRRPLDRVRCLTDLLRQLSAAGKPAESVTRELLAAMVAEGARGFS